MSGMVSNSDFVLAQVRAFSKAFDQLTDFYISHLMDWQAKSNRHSWPSFCSWKSLPSSYGKCPRWLLLRSNSFSDTISPSSGGSDCNLLVDTSRWTRLDRCAMSAGRLTSLLLRRYSFVRWPKCHSDGLRFVIPPAQQVLVSFLTVHISIRPFVLTVLWEIDNKMTKIHAKSN